MSYELRCQRLGFQLKTHNSKLVLGNPAMRTYTVLLLGAACLGLVARGLADEPAELSAAEKTLKEAGVKTDGPALLAFFRQRTLTAQDRTRVDQLIHDLGAPAFK